MKPRGDIFELCDVIRETSFALHRYLRHGHLEKVYKNGLAYRLRKVDLNVETQYPLKVYDEDGTEIWGTEIGNLKSEVRRQPTELWMDGPVKQKKIRGFTG